MNISVNLFFNFILYQNLIIHNSLIIHNTFIVYFETINYYNYYKQNLCFYTHSNESIDYSYSKSIIINKKSSFYIISFAKI